MQPFRITCTTCQARLKVANPAAIGQILACPRCHSMVLVPTPEEAARAAADEQSDRPAKSGNSSDPAATSGATGPGGSTNAGADSHLLSPAEAADSSFETIPAMLSGTYAPVPPASTPPEEPTAAHAEATPATESTLVGSEPMGSAGIELTDAAAAGWTSPTELLWRNVAMWAAGGGAVVLLIGGVLGMWLTRDNPPTVAQATSPVAKSDADDATDQVAEPKADGDPAGANTASEGTPPPDKHTETHENSAVAADPNDKAESKAEPTSPSPPSDESTADTKPPKSDEPAARGDAQAPAAAAPSAPSEAAQKAETSGRTDATAETEAPGSKTAGDGPVAPVPVEAPAPVPPHDAPAWAMLQKEPSEEPDVEADPRTQLEMPLSGAAFPAISLLDFVRLVGDLANVPVTLDAETLRRRGMTPQTTISLSRQEVTAGQLLQDGLAHLRLTYRIEDNQIVVGDGNPSDSRRTTVNYLIDDLTGTSLEETGRLAEQIKQLVAPESWGSGSSDTIEVRAGFLRVEQTLPAQYEILSFCERLRLARGLPLRSRLAREWFPLESYRELTDTKLKQPITFTFDRPVTLREVVDHLERTTGLTILVDWQSLASAGFSPHTGFSCAAKDEPLDRALSAILSALDLGWRAVDRDVLQIVSRQDAQRRHGVVFYDASDLVDAGTSTDELLALAKKSIERSGSSVADGAIQWDPPSRHLIVRHNQDAQEQVRAALMSRRTRPAGK